MFLTSSPPNATTFRRHQTGPQGAGAPGRTPHPEATIRRRYAAGRELLRTVCQPLVDQWTVYDNACDEPQLMDWSGKT